MKTFFVGTRTYGTFYSMYHAIYIILVSVERKHGQETTGTVRTCTYVDVAATETATQ